MNKSGYCVSCNNGKFYKNLRQHDKTKKCNEKFMKGKLEQHIEYMEMVNEMMEKYNNRQEGEIILLQFWFKKMKRYNNIKW